MLDTRIHFGLNITQSTRNILFSHAQIKKISFRGDNIRVRIKLLCTGYIYKVREASKGTWRFLGRSPCHDIRSSADEFAYSIVTIFVHPFAKKHFSTVTLFFLLLYYITINNYYFDICGIEISTKWIQKWKIKRGKYIVF